MQVFYEFHFNHCSVALFELLFFGADLYLTIVTCTDFDCTLRQGCCLAMWSASFIFSWYVVDDMPKTEKQSTPQAFLQLGCRCKCLKMAEFLSVSKCSFWSPPQLRLVFTSTKIGSFFSAKDLLSKDELSMVIYQFTCACCKASYIGESTRSLYIRRKEQFTCACCKDS